MMLLKSVILHHRDKFSYLTAHYLYLCVNFTRNMFIYFSSITKWTSPLIWTLRTPTGSSFKSWTHLLLASPKGSFFSSLIGRTDLTLMD